MKTRLLLPMLLLLLAGCTSLSTDQRHAKDLSKLRHLFVEHRLNDNHGIDQLIVRELQGLGLNAACGPLTMIPDNADAVITYEDDWTFDFSTHMVSLDVSVQTVNKDKALGSGHFFNRGVSRIPPDKMVHEVVSSMFKPG